MFFIEYIKRYYKYIIGGLIALVILSLIIYINVKAVGIENKNVDEDLVKNKTEEKTSMKNETTYYYVDVKGAVKNPGVYKLKNDKRVIDAINAAGGVKENADTSIINLSKKIVDEMCIIIYTNNEIKLYKDKGLTANEINKEIKNQSNIDDSFNDAKIKNDTSSTNVIDINKKISINNATKEELLTLNGIGESKASAIIKYREDNGPFKQIEDIKNVSGIGESLYEKIKDSITL